MRRDPRIAKQSPDCNHLWVSVSPNDTVGRCVYCGSLTVRHHSGEGTRNERTLPENWDGPAIVRVTGEYFIVEASGNVLAGPFLELDEAQLAWEALRSGEQPKEPR